MRSVKKLLQAHFIASKLEVHPKELHESQPVCLVACENGEFSMLNGLKGKDENAHRYSIDQLSNKASSEVKQGTLISDLTNLITTLVLGTEMLVASFHLIPLTNLPIVAATFLTFPSVTGQTRKLLTKLFLNSKKKQGEK